ncbi:hypothetical protein ACS0TY_029133 [Phlomoides rotata]
MEKKISEWTFEENKLFENALVDIDLNSPTFLENVASRVPWKSMEDVKNHYEALFDDIKEIESCKFLLPDYPDLNVEDNQDVTMTQQDQPKKDEGSTPNCHQRRRGVLWTEEEHQLFLMGLNKYEKGDWCSISKNYVISKTPMQVASHAQKYFLCQTSSTPAKRPCHNIHDIQTMTPTPVFIPKRPSTLSAANVDPLLPNFQICGSIPPLLNSSMINSGDPLAPNPIFIPPMNNPIVNNNPNFPSGDPIFIQNNVIYADDIAYPPEKFMLPSMMNQK